MALDDNYADWSDDDLISEVDEREAAKTTWEIDFVEDVMKWEGSLTQKQRDVLIELLKRDDESCR